MIVAASSGSRSLVALLVVAGLGGCAGPAPQLPAAVARVASVPVATVTAGTFAVAGAIPPAQVALALDQLQADLAKRLKPEASSGVLGVSRRADGAPRVTIDAAQAFETGNAQMRPETLLRVAECASAAQAAAAVVVHVVGYGEPAATPDGESLAERRATSVAAYLQERGLATSRVRAEGRVARDRERTRWLELVFEPIVEGREVRAWMPPATPVAAP